jgi:quercetin dioxygenase-like cupin family protein
MQENLTVAADGGVRFEDGPDRSRVIVFERDTGGRFSLMEYVVAAGDKPAPHTPRAYGAHLHRECEETFFVQSGSLEFLLGNEAITLNTGDFVHVPAAVRHGYSNI